ncbi:K02A2.6-like, partial [Cordylochernes scorpioides]
MANNLTSPLPLNLNATDLYSEYKHWMNSYLIYELASGVSTKKDDVKRATLLHCLGPQVQRIFFNLPEEKDTYEKAKEALTKYFTPQKNIVSERFKFRQRKQNTDENIDSYVIALRELVKSCEFGNLEEDMIRDQIIEKCYNRQLKEKLLQQDNLNLQRTIEISRMFETAKEEFRVLTNEDMTSINRVNYKNNFQAANESTVKGPKAHNVYHQKGSTSKMGHLNRVCRNKNKYKNIEGKKRNIQNISENNEDSDEYTFFLGSDNKENIYIDGKEITMTIDTGSDTTFIGLENLKNIFPKSQMPTLNGTERKFYAYGQTSPLPCCGYFFADVSWGERSIKEQIFVIEGKAEPLLGKKASFELEIIKRGTNIRNIQQEVIPKDIYNLIQENMNLFQGQGNVKGYSQKITLKENVTPAAQRCRHFPYKMVEAINQELDKMIEDGIIEEVHEASEWISNIVAVPKKGHIVSKDGIRPDPKKIESVLNFSKPENVDSLKSFLGTCGFLRKFIPDFSKLAEPLNNLTRKDIKWKWSKKEEDSFRKLKEALTKNPCLAYFDMNAPTEVIADASPVGLGAVLLQRQNDGSKKPVAYASRSLTNVERRYSQIEKEALGCVWAVEHFNDYLWGNKFVLKTDHKPLIYMLNPKKATVLPPRIERLSWRLQPYDYEIEYLKGKQNIADIFSRKPLTNISCENIVDDYVEKVLSIFSEEMKAISLNDIKKQSEADPFFKFLTKIIQTGNWPYQIDDDELKSLHKFKEELSVYDNLILKGKRIVIPTDLRRNILDLAHETHQGIARTKQILREKYYWPNMDKDIERRIKNCYICEVNQPLRHDQPLTTIPIPPRPWYKVGVDLVGPIDSKYILTLIDYYSSFPEAIIINDISSKTIISKLKEIFARYGFPIEIVSDNGLQFVSKDTEQFFMKSGIKHIRVSPYYPKSNGKIERFHRYLKKQLISVKLQGKDWKEELQCVLMAYRSTPHPSTGKTPALLLFSREIRNKLNDINDNDSLMDKEVMEHNQAYKERMKKYADSKNKALPHDFKKGNIVYVANTEIKSKLTPNYDNQRFIILETISPNSFKLVNTETGSFIIRNAKHLRHANVLQDFNKGIDLNTTLIKTPEIRMELPSTSRYLPEQEATLEDIVPEEQIAISDMDCLYPNESPNENENKTVITRNQNDPNKWPKWRKKFENYIIASDLDSKTIQQQRAIILHIIGDSALEIYNTFGFEENAQSPTIKDILDKYDQYFRPFKNTIYRRYIFFTCEQKLNKTFDDFVTEIKSKAEDCEFENIKDSLIRDRIVLGCRDTSLREKYLQNSDLTLSLAINQGQAAEASQKQLRNIEKDSIDAIRKNFNEKYKPTTSLKNSYTSNPVRANFNKLIRCSKCNMAHDFGKCPAYGKECYKCRQPNHFSNCCKIRAVMCIQEIEEEKDNLLIIDSIMVGQVLRKPWKELIYIQGHPVDVKLDTGADVNILPERLIKEWPNMPLLETADCKIYTYTRQQIPVVGKCQLDCKTKYACRKVTFLIVNNSAVPILGLDECVNLNLVKRVETISEISVTLTGLLDEYKDVFKGNGHLSYMYDIKISDKAEPKISPARRLPRALLQPVKEELFKMEKDGIIEKIEEPTVWAHPMVVVEKPSGKYRICIDPRELNKWVLREHYTLPVPENILAEIPKAKFYSVLDAKSAFWQVPLSENTSKYLVMSTPFGRYRFLRLPFVISSAPEIFQKIMHKNFCDIPNVVCYIDDLLIWGWPLHKKNLPSNLKPYWEFKEELHEWQNLICRGNKLLIPKTQRSDILKILHASHQGINNTIALAKRCIYWPGINKEIEELINNCSICQQTSRANLKEPMLPHQAPDYPWQKEGIDIYQIESLKYLLIVDYFSKYPEIYQLQDMTTDTIIRRLKRTFSNLGIPETLVSDNGPPFFSKEFQNFTRTWNIVHVTSSPYHAQSNGMVERTVQTLKKLIKRCGEETTDPYLALLNLRNTPHNNLPSPAQILMSRNL